MAKSSGLTHMFTELSSLEELSALMTRSARLKYTCLSVSKKYVALGSNTGGVYIFSRDTLKYLQVVFAETDASQIVCVGLSPSDQHVGFALRKTKFSLSALNYEKWSPKKKMTQYYLTQGFKNSLITIKKTTGNSTGQVAVFELNIEKRTKPERIRLTHDHAGNQVKCLCWDTLSSKLFVGDDQGKLSIVFVPSIKGKTLFSGPSEVIAYLEASIYQMDWWSDKLLVSTHKQTFLFDNIKHNYSTIGTKAREGEFGSCYFFEPSSNAPVIYCARPGSRMWEVDFTGKVLNTHQFKQLLAIPPIPVVQLLKDDLEDTSSVKNSSHSVNFLKMLRLGQFILTWSVKGIYIFDPINVKVVVWTSSIKSIKDICVFSNDLYIFLESSIIQKLTLLPIYQLFTILSTRRKWLLMSNLLMSSDQINIRPAITKRVKQDLLQTLTAGLLEDGMGELATKVLALMDDLSECSVDSLSLQDDFMDVAEVLGHTYLASGMVVVSEGMQIGLSASRQLEMSPDSMMKHEYEPVPAADDGPKLMSNGGRKEELMDGDWSNSDHRTEEKFSLYVKQEDHQTDDAEGTEMSNGHHNRTISTTSVGSEADESLANLSYVPKFDSNENLKGLADIGEEDIYAYNQDIPKNSLELVLTTHAATNVKIQESEAHQEPSSKPEDNLIDDIQNKDTEKKGVMIDNVCFDSSGQNISPLTPDASNFLSETDLESEVFVENVMSADTGQQNSLANGGLSNENQCEEIMFPSPLQHLSLEINTPKEDSTLVLIEEPKSISTDKPVNTEKSIKITKRFVHIGSMASDDSLIAQPVRTGRKKKKKTMAEHKARSSSLGQQRDTVSLGDEPEDLVFNAKPKDYDTMSLGMVSSFDEDDDVLLLPDAAIGSVSSAATERRRSKTSLDFSSSPTRSKDKVARRISAPVSFTEAIPPLKDRLAAARSPYDDSPPSISPLSGSGEHNTPAFGSPRALVAISDGLSQIRSHTKSFIKTFKEKNILMSKSSSSPTLSSLTNQLISSQMVKSPEDTSESLDDLSQMKLSDKASEARTIEEEAAATLDLNSLVNFSREVKKNLGNPSTLLKPKLTLGFLNDWATELNTLMLKYHKVLLEKKKAENLNFINCLVDNFSASSTEENCNYQDNLFTYNQSDNFVTNNETKNNNSIASEDKTNSVTDYNEPDHSDLKAAYWAKIIHSKDPFHLGSGDFELIHYLTTLCFITGATGSLLSFLGLSDEASLQELVGNILPQHLLSSLSSDATCFVSYHSMGGQILPDTMQNASKVELDTADDWNQGDMADKINTACGRVDGMEVATSKVVEPLDSHYRKLGQSPSLLKDISLALFTRLYFFILDYNKVRQELNQQGAGLFLTWVSVLQSSLDVGKGDIVSSLLAERKTNSAFDYLRSGILPRQSAFLGHIYKLFEVSPLKASEFCGEVSKQMSPIDLLNLCAVCGRTASPQFMRYIRHWLLNLPQSQRRQAFHQICENRSLRYLLLETLIPVLSQDIPDSSRVAANQVVAVLPFDWINIILQFIDLGDESEDIANLSIKLGYWPLAIKLQTKANQWQRLLETIIDLGDIKFLKGKHGEDSYIPQNLEQWKYLLKLYKDKQKNLEVLVEKCPDSIVATGKKSDHDIPGSSCESENSQISEVKGKDKFSYESFKRMDSSQADAITWDSLGYLLLGYVGGALTIDLLMEQLEDLIMAQDCLSMEFLYACYMDYKIKLEQDHVTHEMLEKLSAYMWTKKPGFLPPSVYQAVIKEKLLVESGEEEAMSLQSLFSHVQSLDNHKLMSEHLGGHWGQSVDISSPCLVCNIPLKSVMSFSIQGVIVFPCRHAFHRCCVRSPVCPIFH